MPNNGSLMTTDVRCVWPHFGQVTSTSRFWPFFSSRFHYYAERFQNLDAICVAIDFVLCVDTRPLLRDHERRMGSTGMYANVERANAPTR